MPVPLAQVRRVENGDEEIGMGFDSASGLAIGTALEGFTVQANPFASGQEVLASITIVNSHEELMENLGMSFEAQGRYGLFSGSAKAKFSESSNYNSTSTFLIARCIVQNPMIRGMDFAVKPAVQAMLDSLRFDEFKRAFGDSFVRGLQTGGEFYSIIRITSLSTVKQSELAISLQAEYNGLVVDGSFQGEFAKANKNTKTQSEFTATMYQKAGSGAQISPTVEISEVIARFKAFPEIVKSSAVAYETEVATYDTLPLPIPTPEEQEIFIFALRDAREKKMYYIQTRNDLDFARRNPTFFENLPADDVLLTASSVYTRLINAVVDHSVRLSRGQINPPQIFDPSLASPSLAEPASIPLKRVAPSALPTIRVPDMTGLTGDDVLYAQYCLGAGTVDQCFAGTVFFDQNEEPMPIDVSREVAEFIKLAESGVIRLSCDPPNYSSSSGRFVSNAQFPSAGTIVEDGSEIILQFVELPIEY